MFVCSVNRFALKVSKCTPEHVTKITPPSCFRKRSTSRKFSRKNKYNNFVILVRNCWFPSADYFLRHIDRVKIWVMGDRYTFPCVFTHQQLQNELSTSSFKRVPCFIHERRCSMVKNDPIALIKENMRREIE